MKTIRAASVQFQHKPGDKVANLQTITRFVEKAAAQGVKLLVFPEMCITGYWHVRKLDAQQVRDLAETIPAGPSTQQLIKLAVAYGMNIGAGLIEVSETGELYNTYVMALSSGEVHTHRKLHTFISAHMHSGDSFTVFTIPEGVQVGVLICYDNNIVENVRITALMGAQILLAPHQTGGCRTASPGGMKTIDVQLWEHRHVNPEALRAEFQGPKGRGWLLRWLPSRAHDNGLFLIFSNGVGRDDDEVRTGNAMLIDPYGEILAETDSVEDDMVIADLDLDLIPFSTGRRWIKTRRPELYERLTIHLGIEEDTRKVRFSYD